MKNNNEELQKEKKLALHYMQTLVEVSREPFIIFGSDLKIIVANPAFYETFMVLREQTENKFLYELGNGQWNIPELKKLMEEILPNKKTVKDYSVKHVFETIGEKIILLNARQIDSVQLIILCMEDITARKKLEEQLAMYTQELEKKIAERTKELAERIKELESININMVGRELKMVELKKEIANFKKQIKNGNSKNVNQRNGNGRHLNGRSK